MKVEKAMSSTMPRLALRILRANSGAGSIAAESASASVRLLAHGVLWAAVALFTTRGFDIWAHDRTSGASTTPPKER
jgi:hypothetical protein